MEKLKIKDLKIKSFVTKLEDKKLRNVMGGDMYMHLPPGNNDRTRNGC